MPANMKTHSFSARTAFSTLPFVATFVLATAIAYRKVYPLLLLQSNQNAKSTNSKLPQSGAHSSEPPTQGIARRVAAFTFSSTIALSAVLTELLLCEISNSFNPSARSIALQFTVASLLGLLVIAIPLLGIYSVVSKSGYKFRGESKGRRRLAWTFEVVGYTAFLLLFWAIGILLPESRSIHDTLKGQENVFQACLDRLGITGVALMALLSGFASVSAIWHTFGPKPAIVSESDITRKQTGLDATLDMIREKKARLAHLERNISTAPAKSFWTRTVSTFRGNTDTIEKETLEMEINGLETMSASLESTVSVLRSRRAEQLKVTTALGRAMLGFQYLFSCYCVYRIITTTISIARRTFSSRTGVTSNTTDPITYAIALFARHVYPSLDQASWAQQISFLLSGAMLLASFSAVTQTFHLFSRFLPTLMHATRTNFALLISQISGMYVISSALMLRGMMPKEVGSVINSALGSGMLDPGWVQKWFDGFFVSAVVVTAVGVFVGRSVGSESLLYDGGGAWDGDIELGKRS